MDRMELWDELRIKKAASLAGSEAPVRMDTKRAGNFVRETMEKQQKEEVETSRGFFSMIFSRPVYVWGGIGAIAVAGLALVLTLSPMPASDGQTINPAMTSVHASADSLKAATDSVAIEDEDIEIISIE